MMTYTLLEDSVRNSPSPRRPPPAEAAGRSMELEALTENSELGDALDEEEVREARGESMRSGACGQEHMVSMRAGCE